MFIVVFPSFFKRPQRLPQKDATPRDSRRKTKQIRLAKLRAILHEHAPYLLGWTPNDTEISRSNAKSNSQIAFLPPYTEDPPIERGSLPVS